MYLHLDHHSGEPIYRQIVEQVKYRVACGRLRAGQTLPSIRDLARELKINPGTAVRAYEELRHTGLVVMRQGKGVFVSGERSATPSRRREALLRKEVRRLLAEAARLGADGEEVLQLVKEEVKTLETTP